jgi:hypothetical protein
MPTATPQAQSRRPLGKTRITDPFWAVNSQLRKAVLQKMFDELSFSFLLIVQCKPT